MFSSGQESTIASLLEEELLRRWESLGGHFLPSYKVAFALALRLANIAEGMRSFIRSMALLMGLRSLASGASLCFVDVGSDRYQFPPPCSRMLYKPLVGLKKARQRLV